MLNSKLTPTKRNDFIAYYGDILDLLTEKMDLGDVVTLAHTMTHLYAASHFLRFPIGSHIGRIRDKLGPNIEGTQSFS